MRPTIYTVAKRAGVSIATVSRVLNNSDRITAETRAKVLEAMQELGYRPSAAARGLARSTTETIALLFPEVSGPFFSEIIRGIETEARRHRYHLLIYGLHGAGQEDQLLTFLSSRVDGMILGSHCGAPYIQRLQEQGVPFVLLNQRLEGQAVDSIETSSFEGAYQAVDHLIEHGYASIAFVAGPASSRQNQIRLAAYHQALRDREWTEDPRWIVEGHYVERGGERAMEVLLALSQPPRAVFAANDQMAIGAIDAIRACGLSVPDDVAVVGFDDLPVAAYIHPALTTVRRSVRESGELAVQLLIRRIEQPTSPAEHVVLPTELVVRRSCGCERSV
jgi:DNA-binding LacI/PurR family transcriptional regulator